MRAIIDIDEETMCRLAGALELSPFFDETDSEPEVDGDKLSYAIKLMVELYAD